MEVTEDELLTSRGDKITFGIVHKQPAILIIPWDGEHLTMVRQYRYAVDFESWELPAGHMEHDSLLSAAEAELKEETGIKANKFKELGTFHIAPGHLTQVCHVYLATDLVEGKQNLEKAEFGMEIGKFTLTKLNQMIVDGEIKDGLTITSVKLFELYLHGDQV